MIVLQKKTLDTLSLIPEEDIVRAYNGLLLSGKAEAAAYLRKHAGYIHPTLFYLFYIVERDSDFSPFSKIHYEMLAALPRGAQGKKINILAPRGSAKSTLMAVIYPLWRIVYKEWDEALGVPSERHILIISSTHTTASDRIADIKSHIDDNEKILSDFGDLRGRHRWGVQLMETANGVRVAPYSRESEVRGALRKGSRPTLIIADDFDHAERIINEEWRTKTLNWVNTDLLRLGRLDGKSNFIFVDTMKHSAGTSAALRSRPGWETLEYRAIEVPATLYHPNPDIEALWKQWEKLYNDMTVADLERVTSADTFYREHQPEMTQGVVETWSEKISYLQVRKEICEVGYWATMRELQNIALSPDESTFDMENAVRFRFTSEGMLRSDDSFACWRDLTGYRRPSESQNCLCAIGLRTAPLARRYCLLVRHSQQKQTSIATARHLQMRSTFNERF